MGGSPGDRGRGRCGKSDGSVFVLVQNPAWPAGNHVLDAAVETAREAAAEALPHHEVRVEQRTLGPAIPP